MNENIKKKSSGLSIAGLVLGIVGVVISWIPIVNFFSIPLGIIGLIFGIIGLAKKNGGIAIAATICSACAIVIVFVCGLVFTKVSIGYFGKAIEDIANSKGVQVVGEPKIKSKCTDGICESTITGVIENKSGKNKPFYNYVSFEAYNENGEKIGTCAGSTGSIPNGKKWKFEATCDNITQKIVKVKTRYIF